MLVVVHAILFLLSLPVKLSGALSAREALEGQREKCQTLAKYCKYLTDGQPGAPPLDPELHPFTQAEVDSLMSCDISLGKCTLYGRNSTLAQAFGQAFVDQDDIAN
jgi:hypothetical protein